MSFDNIRLPDDIERGALGGPAFNTSVISLVSGYEQRQSNWSRTRGSWDIGYGVQSKEDLEDVISFFYGRQGRARGFRFKDWTDYEIGSTGSPQAIALGDDAQEKFQIVRRYTQGGVTFDRPVTRLVSGTVSVFEDGSAASSNTVDVNTGIITFGTPPGPGVVIGVVAEFDVPVRFDTDKLDLRALRDDVLSVPSIPIVEIREDLGSLS
jgi:uncharacterized protein (TIGR02217 family)